VRLHVCGVRGSTPAPGSDFVRYGGHTSCIAIARDGAAPSLVLDAGTGLRRLSALLEGAPFRGTILLGHLHWDHTQGLPFFAAGDRPDARVRLLLPDQGEPAEGVLERMMSPPHFPIPPGGLRGAWSFENLPPGEHEIEGFAVLAREIPHKGGRTFGYRVSDGRSTVAYLSDHAPGVLGPGPEGLGEYHEAALALAEDADVLFHDAQYTAEEYTGRVTWGHAAVDYAVGLGAKAGARRVMLHHHDPNRTDEAVDAIAAGAQRPGITVEAACEGAVLTLG
jgi:phosphoribosyl 1,2-cyclic phosphodiesterase